MTTNNRAGRWLSSAVVLTAMAAGGAGCLSRPVGVQPPTTKVNFTSTVSQQAVDKVDILFAIDNSSSMGDKQKILSDAVPDLIQGLLQPKCVTPDGVAAGAGKVADPKGNKDNHYGCPTGTDPEFKPVSDMHIAVISSSLGSFGGDVCPDSGRSNDHAHLLNIAGVKDASSTNFLAWFPTTTDNNDATRHPKPQKPITDIGTAGDGTTAGTGLTGDFQQLVTGVGQDGCGLEAQLESMYHFLIAPDPWVKVTVVNGQADYGTDVDVDVIQQRADFLRPDSLVAVIMLTDEEDSSADPLSVGGQGWAFMAYQFPGSNTFRSNDPKAGTTAPRGTTACTSGNPGAAACTSCGFAKTCDQSKPECKAIVSDSNCTDNNGYYGATDDDLNVRFHRMKERYGIDPQYPVSRYVDGFTKTKVADRKNEHPINGKSIGNYAPTLKCTNPLFAAKLPSAAGDELCNLQRGTRSSDLIFFAIVGGVPNNLLHFDPTNPDSSRLTNEDWTAILGADPINFDYKGIDSHMIQSVDPRQGLPGPSTKGDNGTDKVHGREWDTKGADLQYACTFDLPLDSQRTCDGTGAAATSCDCGGDKAPPLCNGTKQIKAKAYPTVREFEVARALGDNGIAASLCPISLDPAKKASGDGTYGYRPAVAAIIDRLKNALTTQCLPQQLTRDTSNQEVPCLVLAQLPDPGDTCQAHQLDVPPAEILSKFKEQQKEESGNTENGGTDLSTLTVCVVPQLHDASGKGYSKGDTCQAATDIGWCYVENDVDAKKLPAGRCPQALIFSSGSSALPGARFSLQCIQQFSAGQAAGDTAKQ